MTGEAPTDVFGIVVLVVLLLVLVFLAVTVFYYFNMTRMRHPNAVEATLLGWLGLFLLLVVLGLVIYAVIHIFRHEGKIIALSVPDNKQYPPTPSYSPRLYSNPNPKPPSQTADSGLLSLGGALG